MIENFHDGIIVRFNRPEMRNPISIAVLDQLDKIVDKYAADTKINCIIFTGTGESFASGADLREVSAVKQGEAPGFARKGQRLMEKIENLPQNTMAAINGFCFGGALDLILACDWRIASPLAQFAHPGTGLGIITGWGGTQRLPRLIGRCNALEMFFTASPIGARRAFSIGLIDEIADDPMARAVDLSHSAVVG